MTKRNYLMLVFLVGAINVYGQTADSLEPKTDSPTLTLARPLVTPPLYVISEENKTFTYNERNYAGNSSTSNILEKIDHSLINSITVLKDKSATDMYGLMGQHGVIIINLKQGSLDKMPLEVVEKFKIK